jgi:hypothetical protein
MVIVLPLKDSSVARDAAGLSAKTAAAVRPNKPLRMILPLHTSHGCNCLIPAVEFNRPLATRRRSAFTRDSARRVFFIAEH